MILLLLKLVFLLLLPQIVILSHIEKFSVAQIERLFSEQGVDWTGYLSSPQSSGFCFTKCAIVSFYWHSFLVCLNILWSVINYYLYVNYMPTGFIVIYLFLFSCMLENVTRTSSMILSSFRARKQNPTCPTMEHWKTMWVSLPFAHGQGKQVASISSMTRLPSRKQAFCLLSRHQRNISYC
jgi:hypothetical protein